MVSDKNIKNNLIFLDDILKALIEESNFYTLSFGDLYTKIFEFPYEEHLNLKEGFTQTLYDSGNFDFDVSLNTKSAEKKLLSALLFLNNEKYIFFNAQNLITVGYKGLLLYPKGFKKDHIEKERDKNIVVVKNLLYVIITLSSFFLGLLFSC